MRFVAFFSIFFLSFGFLYLPYTQAQALPATEELSISFSPQYPRPYDTVRITVGSTLLNLSASTITISVNGTVVAENERTASFTMGGPGSKSVISVVTKDVDGTHTKSVTLAPADVALIVESGSTVPPLYKGARLVASEGNIRVIALPDFQTSAGAKIAPQNLSYTWKFGDKVLEAQSGIGKNVLTAVAPVRYRDARITVTVVNQERTLVAQGTTLISPVDPLLRIYTSDPLRGIDFSRALSGSLTLVGDEQTFHMVPFFYASAPALSWTLNGAASDSDSDITVRTTGASKGSAVLGAKAIGTGIINNAESRFTIQFGEAKGTGIFGL